MTKKQNTLVFIFVGTVVNVFLSIFFIIVLSIVGIKLFPEQANAVVPVTFIGGILLGMWLYQMIANFVIKKFNLEDKLDPLLSAKLYKKRRD